MDFEPRPNEAVRLVNEMNAIFERLVEIDPDGLLKILQSFKRVTEPVVDKRSALAS